MANPICLSPLKFYDTLEKQERYKSYAYGHISPVIMPLSIIHPFQLVLNTFEDQITGFNICSANTNKVVTNIVDSVNELNSLKYYSIDGYTVAMYLGLFPILDLKHQGEYYIHLETQKGDEYYSEIFCMTNDLSDCLEIEYWNPESDFFMKNGLVTFANNFHFKLLLRSELGKPEYNFEEEATKRLGYSFIESQVSKKIYKFNAVLPEYLCDALRLVRLCSNKKLTSLGETHTMLSFEMDVDWEQQGDLASVNCEFEVDNIIVNTGSFKKELFGGDFNRDFDTNFKVQ